MDERSELQQAWEDLQDTPSYFERYQSSELVVTFCGQCGFWHDEGEECPMLAVEV